MSPICRSSTARSIAGSVLSTVVSNLPDSLAPRSKEKQERMAGAFRVEAFRVPLLRARVQAVVAELATGRRYAIESTFSSTSPVRNCSADPAQNP